MDEKELKELEKERELYLHRKKVSMITDPRFTAIEERLLSFLGYIAYQYCKGGVFPSQQYVGQMMGLSSALRMVEYEFVEGIETGEEKMRKRLESEDRDEVITAMKEIGKLRREVKMKETQVCHAKEDYLKALELTPEQYKVLEKHVLEEETKE